MKKLLFSIVVCLLFPIAIHAQIGYQVSLLNSATGEPRANERVSVTVEITNNAGEAIFSSTQNATSNDFGIISLTIGNADTFKDVDWAKLPFFIAVTIEGKLIAKSQILNVPLAEAAKTLVPAVSLDELCGKTYKFCQYDDTWVNTDIIFNKDKTFTRKEYYNRDFDEDGHYIGAYVGRTTTGKFFIEGRYIYGYDINSDLYIPYGYFDNDSHYKSEKYKFGSLCLGEWLNGDFYFKGVSWK